MEIALLFGLILINGLFAMSEIALVTAKKARLQRLVESGDTAAAAALALGEHPTRFLSVIQIGITSIGVLNGIIGESAFSGPVANWLQSSFPLEEEPANLLATALVVVVITYFSIVVGELVPKRLGQLAPESIARLVAQPMIWLGVLTRPFVRLLSVSTDLLLKLMRVGHSSAHAVTEEDIQAMLAEGSSSGVIEETEHTLVRNVFRLDERQINSLMIPRGDMVCLDIQDTPEAWSTTLGEAGHSSYPVVDGGLEHILGITSTKVILAQALRGETLDLTKALQAPIYVPETLTGMELLENFRANNIQLALVVDEYGELQGMVTLKDLLEAITGEFQPETADDAWAVQREDGSWLLDGLIPLPELRDRLSLGPLPDEDKGRYHTLSGLILLLLGRVPRTGDIVRNAGWIFEVVDMDRRRIDKVLATPEAPVEEETHP